MPVAALPDIKVSGRSGCCLRGEAAAAVEGMRWTAYECQCDSWGGRAVTPRCPQQLSQASRWVGGAAAVHEGKQQLLLRG